MTTRKTLPSMMKLGFCLLALTFALKNPAPAEASSPTTIPVGLDCDAWTKIAQHGSCTPEGASVLELADNRGISKNNLALADNLSSICEAAGYNFYADSSFKDYPFINFTCAAGPDPFADPDPAGGDLPL